ncbi:Hypothetical predicted protein [Octopus vulgaris]|uniref:Uncharacterized protein n=1 Tax=Octopus vulgaris TaxID=6645 RepID=A0AA36AI39_OCTVU|nr:Hypothetical predicted protein [Octopus vulgaris]
MRAMSRKLAIKADYDKLEFRQLAARSLQMGSLDFLTTSLNSIIECTILERQLRWVEHVIRILENRIPKTAYFEELAENNRPHGSPKKRYKDYLKKSLKLCNIFADELETLATNRTTWRGMVKTGTQHFENGRTRLREQKRRRLKEHQQNPRRAHLRRSSLCCSQCNRTCTSRIGLLSHEKACQRHQDNP